MNINVEKFSSIDINIRTNDGQSIDFKMDRDNAVELSARLLEYIGLLKEIQEAATKMLIPPKDDSENIKLVEETKEEHAEEQKETDE